WRICVRHGIVTQQVLMDVSAVVPATDIVEGAIANHEGSARGKWQRSNLRPLLPTGRARRRGGWCSSAYAGGCKRLAGTDRRGLSTRRIATILIEVRVIFLNSYHQLAIISRTRGIDDVVDELEGLGAVL